MVAGYHRGSVSRIGGIHADDHDRRTAHLVMYYDMDGNPIEDVLEWGRLFESADRIIGKFYSKDAVVSTMWLGINHNFGGGPPLIFETMIFGGAYDQYVDRYSTKEQALEGHNRAVRLVLGE